MIFNTDGIRLRIIELEAIMSLYAKQTLFGFPVPESVTPEALWNATCKLLADGLLTGIEDEYILRRDVYEAIRPIYEAEEALVLTPGDWEHSSRIYYLGKKVSVMIPVGLDSVSLYVIERTQIAEAIMESDLLQRGDRNEPVQKPKTGTTPEMTADQLREGAAFVLELFDTQTGERRQWLRGFLEKDIPWLECMRDGEIIITVLTKQILERAILQIEKD